MNEIGPPQLDREGKGLGVAWYLYPDEGHNTDGRHIGYLQQSEKW